MGSGAALFLLPCLLRKPDWGIPSGRAIAYAISLFLCGRRVCARSAVLNALMIAGTDVGVGKTVVTAALAAYWKTYQAGRTLGIFKPVQTGGGDRDLYQRLFSLQQSPQEITPISFQTPIAPPIAARQAGSSISVERIWHTFETLAQHKDWVLMEAFGGLGSPITDDLTMADLAWEWRIPTILVVPVKLGSIGQAVANVALARQSRVHLKGILLNCVQPHSPTDIENWAPIPLIQTLTGLPVLGVVPHLSDPTNLTDLAQVASGLNLERIVPLSMAQVVSSIQA